MNRNSKNQYISRTVKEHSFQKRSVIQWNPISISYLNNCENKKGSVNWRCFLECLLSSLEAASAAVLPKHSSRQPQASHRTSCKHHPHLPETQLSGTSREKPTPVPRVQLTRQHQPTSTTAPFSVFSFISATHPVGSYETKQNLKETQNKT